MNEKITTLTFYRKLLAFYPSEFREQLGESMEQTFNDLYNERKQQTKHSLFTFVLWTFIETAIGIVWEHILLIKEMNPMNTTLRSENADSKASAVTTQKWGGLASFLLAVAFIVAPLIYLMGNLRDAMGPFTYDLADFLYGPILAASLVTLIFVLRERIGEHASRRMDLALLAAVLSAGAMAAVAFIRASNRHYHLMHPELNLENSTTILIVWTTLVAGVSAVGFHFLGWTFVLVGSAGWTSGRLPRVLSALYLLAGTSSLFVYLLPELEGNVLLLGFITSIWQGILLWKAGSGEMPAPEINASQPHQA